MIKMPLEGPPMIIVGNECTKKETATFKNNGKVEAVYYYYDNGSECTINESASVTFDWDKISEGFYNISRGGNTGTTHEVSSSNANNLHLAQQLATANGLWKSYSYVYNKI